MGIHILVSKNIGFLEVARSLIVLCENYKIHCCGEIHEFSIKSMSDDAYMSHKWYECFKFNPNVVRKVTCGSLIYKYSLTL